MTPTDRPGRPAAHIPEGFTTVCPYIFAEDADAYLDYLRDGLGGEITGTHHAPDSTRANGQVRVGAMTPMVSEAGGGMRKTYGTFYIYAEDAHAAMARAIAAGGTLRSEVADMPLWRSPGRRHRSAGQYWISQHLETAVY